MLEKASPYIGIRGRTPLLVALLLLFAGVSACGRGIENPGARAEAPAGRGTAPDQGSAAERGLGDAPFSGPVEKVTIAYPSLSGAMAFLAVAKEGGVFSKYGIDADLVYIQGSSTLVAALVSGDVQMAHVAGAAVVQSILGGADLVMVGGTVHKVVQQFYVRPGISSPADLRGKVIGISRYGTSDDFQVRRVMAQYGLQEGVNVSLLQAGGEPQKLAALESGAIDAASLAFPTTLEAQKAGFNLQVDFVAQNIPYQSSAVVASRQFVRDNPAIVKRMLMAVTEAVHYFKSNPDFAKKVISSSLRTEDPEIIQETYNLYAERLLEKVPYPTLPGIKAILEELSPSNPAAASARPEDMVDMGFMREIESSGFIAKLYGSR